MEPVTVKIGEKEYRLKMTLLGTKRFREATGVPLADAAKLSPDEVVGAMFWACLAWENPEIKLDEALNLIDVRQFEEIMAAVQAVSSPLT